VSLRDVMAVWVQAWALFRDVEPPVSIAGGGWRTEVGKADQLRRFTFVDCDPSVIGPVAESVDEPFVFLKVCCDAPVLAAALPENWRAARLGYIMTDDAPLVPARLPDGYAATVRREGPFIRAEIRTGGVIAATGQAMVMDGGLVFYDQIATDAAHRRRGLGQALMLSLKAAAMEDGARSGALASSLMGRDLYLSLGWRQAADYTTGASPGTEPFP